MKQEAAEGLAPETERRLRLFVALLLRWNRRINLIARADEPHVWERHILDSTQLLPLLPAPTGLLVDLGSGAGFPGLVLAIATGWQVHLVESDARKASFLRQVARETATAVTIHAARAETLVLPPAQVVTARALAPLAQLLALAVRFLAPDGVCLFPKGKSAAEELTEACREWHMRVEQFPSRTSPTATLLRLREICRVPTSG